MSRHEFFTMYDINDRLADVDIKITHQSFIWDNKIDKTAKNYFSNQKFIYIYHFIT